MNKKFEEALGIVLKWEGGFVNDPLDKGGATNYGISLAFLKNAGVDKSDLDQDQIVDEKIGDLNNDGNVDENDIILLTKEYAAKLYHQFFWRDIEYIKDQNLANQVFSLSVNCGYKTAVTLLQKACRFLKANIVVDGVLGPKTEVIVNSLDPVELNNTLVFMAERYYEGIVQKSPSQYRFLKGWKRRAKSFLIEEK
ncbi:MAG TPA: glycosyl hydrolase 108 family protein [Bacteroidales bacterium]|nr:glycosyl hydrolase 108 family protein [Bacteroidales bacterium]